MSDLIGAWVDLGDDGEGFVADVILDDDGTEEAVVVYLTCGDIAAVALAALESDRETIH